MTRRMLSLVSAALCLFSASARADDLAQPDSELMDDADSSKRSTPISAAALEDLLQTYSKEPKVEQVVTAALKAAQHDPAKYAAMAGRARLRGLLPHLDLGARRGQGIDLRWTPTEDLEAHRTTADDVTLFATLRFDLDRLMFTGEEVSIAREARNARHAEQQLIRAVVHVYFLRRRLMLERDLLAGSSISQQLRISEAEALLDAFTDGAFQRMLTNSKTRHGEPAQAPTLPSGNSRGN